MEIDKRPLFPHWWSALFGQILLSHFPRPRNIGGIREKMGPGSTSVIQITNIAPTVTNEQLRALIAFVGAVKEFVVYPSK